MRQNRIKHASNLYLCIALMAISWSARAAVEVSFVEGAPKDRFVITNTSACTIAKLRLVIDLGPSAGGLYFDTTAEGAGVQVFQPFETADQDLRLVNEGGNTGDVSDGQNSLEIEIARLAAGARVEFTIDVDDSVVDGWLGQTRVASAEIAGARIRLEQVGQPPLEEFFDATGRALTPAPGCETVGS